jgi:hypothetical protein
MSFKTRLAIAGILSSVCISANATLVTYIAGDNGVSSLADMVNSTAEAAVFNAVTGLGITYDFESATLPSNLNIAGGSGRTNNSGCGPLCGINTTVAGSYFELAYATPVTFSFATPVDSFGFYVTGLQTNLVGPEIITFVNGSQVTQTINFPPAINGGGAFVGFVDYGDLISSVTFNPSNDIVAFDDLRFGNSATNPSVPEPATLALLGIGLAGIGFSRKRKSN